MRHAVHPPRRRRRAAPRQRPLDAAEQPRRARRRAAKQQKPSRTTRASRSRPTPGGKGDPADPTTRKRVEPSMHGLTEACLKGTAPRSYSHQLLYVYRRKARQATYECHALHPRRSYQRSQGYTGRGPGECRGAAEVFERKVYGEEVDQATAAKHTWTSTAHKAAGQALGAVHAEPRVLRRLFATVSANLQDHPEVRHTLFVSTANKLRKHELRQFVAHEIGTHLLRVVTTRSSPGAASGREKSSFCTRTRRASSGRRRKV